MVFGLDLSNPFQEKKTTFRAPIISLSNDVLLASMAIKNTPAGAFASPPQSSAVTGLPASPNLRQRIEEADGQAFAEITRSNSIGGLVDKVKIGADPATIKFNLGLLKEGITEMRKITLYSELGEMADSQRGFLEKRFQETFAEFQTLMEAVDFGSALNLVQGLTSDEAKTKTLYTQPTPVVEGQGVTVDENGVVQDLDPSSTLSIRITKEGVTQTIAASLSEVTGDLTLGNIASLLNDKISDAGFGTNFSFGKEANEEGIGFTGKHKFHIIPGKDEGVVITSAEKEDYAWQAINQSTAGFDTPIMQAWPIGNDPNATPVSTVSMPGEIVQTSAISDGGFYAVTKQENDGVTDLFLTRHDSGGAQIWSQAMDTNGSAENLELLTDNNGNITVAYQELNDDLNVDITAKNFDLLGQRQWTHNGNTSTSNLKGLEFDSNGDIVLQITSRSSNSASEILLDDADGKTLSKTSLSVPSGLFLKDGTRSGTDSYHIYGDGSQSRIEASTGSGTWNIDLAGESLTAVESTADGLYIATDDGSGNATLRHYDTAGNLSWSQTEANTTIADIDVNATNILTNGDTVNADSKNVSWTASFQTGGTRNWERESTSAISSIGGGHVSPNSWLADIGLSEGMTFAEIAFSGDTKFSNFTDSLVSRTGLKEGDSFEIHVGSKKEEIVLAADTNLDTLVRDIKSKFRQEIKVTPDEFGDIELALQPYPGYDMKLVAGPDGSDALSELGLEPGVIKGKVLNSQNGEYEDPYGQFGLEIFGDISVRDTDKAKTTDGILVGASRTLDEAFQYISDPAAFIAKKEAAKEKPVATGTAPAYLTARTAAYQDALARLGGGGGFF